MGQYYYIPDPGEQRSGFATPVPDRLAQLRQNQMQQPIISGSIQPQPTPPTPQSNPIWVQGEEGAKAYMVSPGSSVMLMDSENTVFYLKSSDQSGMPLPLAVMITIPEPWANNGLMSQKKKDFYQYYATMMEPWDGPASILFSDGGFDGRGA